MELQPRQAKHQRLVRCEGPVLNAFEKLWLAVLRQLLISSMSRSLDPSI